MPVPGYDPDDIDALLETKLSEADIRARLSDDEWQSYQNEDGSLVDLLDENEIEQVLDDE